MESLLSAISGTVEDVGKVATAVKEDKEAKEKEEKKAEAEALKLKKEQDKIIKEKQKKAEYKESLGQSIVSENATRDQMKIYKNRRALGFSHEDALEMAKIKLTDEQKQRYAQSRRLISIDKANRGGTKL
jgi:hypothetical protein